MTLRNALSALVLSLTLSSTASAADPLVARGEYLAQVMDCAGCHMPRAKDGSLVVQAGLSGGNVGFEIPGLGIFWPPNLTSAPTGLGEWSEKDIEVALRTGIRPDGRALAPAMPWPSYAALTNDDMRALVAYLKSLPPVASPRLEPVSDASKATAPFYRVTLPQ